MAASVAAISGIKREAYGQQFHVHRRVTFDNSYVTGGEPITAAQFGLRNIKLARAWMRDGFASGFAHVDALAQTDGSLLLRLRAAAGTQVASEADAATVVVDVEAIGH